jgi:hypothetical protein
VEFNWQIAGDSGRQGGMIGVGFGIFGGAAQRQKRWERALLA